MALRDNLSRYMRVDLSQYNHHWQWNGKESFHAITIWCREKFGPEGPSSGNWEAVWETIYFVNERDYLFFLLRWQ